MVATSTKWIGYSMISVENEPIFQVKNHKNYPQFEGAAKKFLDDDAIYQAHKEITSWPGYIMTPLIDMKKSAKFLRISSLLYKDESRRFELASFKALGGAYAVLKTLQQKLKIEGISATTSDLISRKFQDLTIKETVVCATDGNHGRSVAWGAKMFGCQCRIYLHENVSQDRENAISLFGAKTIRKDGDYDTSVRAAANDAEKFGWSLLADTNAGGGSEKIPLLVMHGYSIIVSELIEQLSKSVTHVFVPAGVGGLAAAIAGRWSNINEKKKPAIIVVEPNKANCVYRAIMQGSPVELEGDVNSFMACLSAGTVSPAAWPIIATEVDHVITISDEIAKATMRALASGFNGDQPLISGESGCATVAAIIAVTQHDEFRKSLGIDSDSRIVAIGSEGATAPELWQEVVGFSPITNNTGKTY